MKKLYFLFGVHNHQPVGNFPYVFDNAYKLAYGPFIELMDRHPKIKFALHCSGILWDYFRDKHREYLELVKKMISRGQLEILSGGYYEPILLAIPDRDKIGQIKKLTDYIQEEFNFKTRGLWLTERIWEGRTPKILSEAGLEYTIVDDYHFIVSGISQDNLTGYYVTEEQGYCTKIFPINQKLRYLIPWEPVEKTFEYLNSQATDKSNSTCLVMMDDGEKFGLWPGTHKLVYDEKWLDDFFTEIEKNSSWIETLTFSEFIDMVQPKGRIYLPQASYFEMTEWSLPQETQEELQDVVEGIAHLPQGPKIKKFLRGGLWQNFFVKYAESNNMHKKMLYVSNKILQVNEQMSKLGSKKVERTQALNHLYQGQCNCAYWHGVFGGLYLPHLRHAVYKKLISAETIADGILNGKQKSKIAHIKQIDFDCDGKDELILETQTQNLYFMPHTGGALFEWDIKNICVNILNVLTRRKEAYHRKLKKIEATKKISQQKQEGKSAAILGISQTNFYSIEENLETYLCYDWYRKVSLIDHFLHPDTQHDNFRKCQYREQGDFVLSEYSWKYTKNKLHLYREGIVWIGEKKIEVRIEKIIIPQKRYGLIVQYYITNLTADNVAIFFAPEFNFSFLSKKNEDELNIKTSKFERIDEIQGVKLSLEFDRESKLWTFPIETVSLSEAGFEKTYQGTTILPVWDIELSAQKTVQYNISLIIESESC